MDQINKRDLERQSSASVVNFSESTSYAPFRSMRVAKNNRINKKPSLSVVIVENTNESSDSHHEKDDSGKNSVTSTKSQPLSNGTYLNEETVEMDDLTRKPTQTNNNGHQHHHHRTKSVRSSLKKPLSPSSTQQTDPGCCVHGHINQGYSNNCSSINLARTISNSTLHSTAVVREQYWSCCCKSWTLTEKILMFIVIFLILIIVCLITVIGVIVSRCSDKNISTNNLFSG